MISDDEHRLRQREANRRWREKNPEKARAAVAAWRKAHPDYNKIWNKANPEKVRARAAKYYASHPEKERARGLKRYADNPERERERVRKYRERDPKRTRELECDGYLRRQYGMSRADFDALLIAQDGRCAICGDAFSPAPCVDHDHVTGAIRGLLCRFCNLGLGYYERPGFAIAAEEYLRTHDRGRQTDAA